MTHRASPIILRVAAAIFSAASLAAAADPFYFGTWKVASAVVAPWVEKGQTPDPAEMKSLTGKSMTIARTGITGPRALACRGPKYRIRNYPADGLFQGGFGEMHRKDPSADPVKIAAGLGFQGTSTKTLETGCSNELEFHFVDSSTAEFALSNYIYTLKKQ